jgi:acyl-CoA hydrolase
VRGAYASEGGKSFHCLPSVYEKNGVSRSRIVPQLTLGNIFTTPRSDVMYVVTEWAIANLKGRSVADRALSLNAIAHPDFREDLMRAARDARMIPPHDG